MAEKEVKGIKKFFEEFKAFAMRGNVLDMAVGVVIGGAFTAIVNSLVNDIINPAIGLFFNADFSPSSGYGRSYRIQSRSSIIKQKEMKFSGGIRR